MLVFAVEFFGSLLLDKYRGAALLSYISQTSGFVVETATAPAARAGIQLIPAHERIARWAVRRTTLRCRAVRTPDSLAKQKIPSRLAWDLWWSMSMTVEPLS